MAPVGGSRFRPARPGEAPRLLGLDEGYILPPQEARRMEQVIPDCDLVEVEDTNHYDVLYSAPKTTVEAARAFLARLASGG